MNSSFESIIIVLRLFQSHPLDQECRKLTAKLFNRSTCKSNTLCVSFSNTVLCPHGLRLIELRGVPDGAVCHHWEFLQPQPPTRFYLDAREISKLVSPSGSTEVSLLVEDDCGNILKKKINIASLRLRCST